MTVRRKQSKAPITVSVRIDEDLLEQIRQVARENDRTITGELRRALKSYLANGSKAA